MKTFCLEMSRNHLFSVLIFFSIQFNIFVELMSSSNFESGERVRIAHQGNPQSSSLQADMDAKKALLSQNVRISKHYSKEI